MLNKNQRDIGIRILVICIESSNRSTEQMYFKNGLKKDTEFLNRLNIHQLNFLGWDFNFLYRDGWKKH